MTPQEIQEELLVLQTSLFDEELEWVEEEQRLLWQPALSEAEPPSDDLPLPSLSLRLAASVQLAVQYRQNARPTFSIHSLVLEREEQAVIAKELEKEAEKIAGEDEPLPVFTVFTAMQGWIAAHPLSSSRPPSVEPLPPPPKAAPIQLKTTLLWSHHLLATSKRKDIVSISTELELWGISKPGYPGIFLVEGAAENVDDFVHRVKQWQWKALQVRCEQPGQLVTPPPDVPPSEALTWVMRNRSLLGPVLSPSSKEKICVKEVESLNEVGELMRKAGLYDVFLTAMKL